MALLQVDAPQWAGGPWNPQLSSPNASLAQSPDYKQPHLVFDAERGTYTCADDAVRDIAAAVGGHVDAPGGHSSGDQAPPAATGPQHRRRTLATPFADLNPSQVRAVAADAADIVMHVDTLQRREADTESLLEATGALAALCSTSRAGQPGAEAMRRAIANAGAIPALVPLLEARRHKQPRVAASAAWALASLLYSSALNRETALVAGAAQRLVQLLASSDGDPAKPSPDDSGAPEEAAYALKALCWQHPLSKQAVVEAGGLPALVRLIARSRRENTLVHACGALANVAVERTYRRAVVEEGGVPPLLQLLSSKRALVLQEAAALAVKTLAWEEETNKRALRKAGAVTRLVRLLERKAEHADTNVTAASQLPEGWSQHWTPDGRAYYKDHQTHTTHWTPPAATAPTLLRSQKRLAGAQLAAVQALLNLSYEKGRGRRALITANAPPALRRLRVASYGGAELKRAATKLLKRLGYREGMDGVDEEVDPMSSIQLPPQHSPERRPTTAPPASLSAAAAAMRHGVDASALAAAADARPATAPAASSTDGSSEQAQHGRDDGYVELRDGVARIEDSIAALRAELAAGTLAPSSAAAAPAPTPAPAPSEVSLRSFLTAWRGDANYLFLN